MVVNGEEKAVRVPHLVRLQRSSDTQFSSLKPAHQMELVRDEDKRKNTS